MADEVREAKVFARPLRSAVPGMELDGNGKVGREGDIFDDESELYDWDLDEIGTVKLLILWSVVCGLESFFAKD